MEWIPIKKKTPWSSFPPFRSYYAHQLDILWIQLLLVCATEIEDHWSSVSCCHNLLLADFQYGLVIQNLYANSWGRTATKYCQPNLHSCTFVKGRICWVRTREIYLTRIKCRCHSKITVRNWTHCCLNRLFHQVVTSLTSSLYWLNQWASFNNVDLFQYESQSCFNTRMFTSWMVPMDV